MAKMLQKLDYMDEKLPIFGMQSIRYPLILKTECGFRIYPIERIVEIIEQEFIGNRMDFDTEILIHSYWQKIPLIWIDTPVRYAEDGVSHFRSWADNWLISKMHARLFFGMLKRLFTGKMR